MPYESKFADALARALAEVGALDDVAPLTRRTFTRERVAGVYLVRRAGVIQYIGSSADVDRRTLAGHDEIEIGDEIEIRYCHDEITARSVESFLIERFKPPRNRRS